MKMCATCQKGQHHRRTEDTISIIPRLQGAALRLTFSQLDRVPDPRSATEPTRNFSHEEIRRYSRHLIVPEVGMEGQKKLKASSVLLIGAGGLGRPLALYLAAAGVGRIGIVDFDVVDESNLQRQVIHGTRPWARPSWKAPSSASLT